MRGENNQAVKDTPICILFRIFGFRLDLVVCLTTESEATLIARRLFAGYIREMETEWRDCRGKAAMELEGGKTSEDIHYLGLGRKRY